MAKMTTFVLVHGAWHGGWCYKWVAARRTLRRGGAQRRLRTLVSNFVHTPSVNERILLDRTTN
jgi:hypothetical protein